MNVMDFERSLRYARLLGDLLKEGVDCGDKLEETLDAIHKGMRISEKTQDVPVDARTEDTDSDNERKKRRTLISRILN